MSVVIETTLGDITVDLFVNDRPRACLNFLKLCKIKYYNYNLFHTISRGFIAQTGDPTGSRNGGESIYGVLDGQQKRFFEGENEPRIKHTRMGLISFVGNEDRMVGSQFFFTLGEDLTYLDEKHCVFGEVVEGFDILEIINEVICDNDDRPYQDVRITHTVILDDPFPNPKRLILPSRSPSPSAERLKGGRIAPDEEIDEMEGKSQEEVIEMQAEREAKARATILEMVGDLPDADMAPPENVLFVCKLNPVTNDDDLEIIFSRFGKIKSCEVIRDKKTGDSLQYAFVEFEDKAACENAYFKMDNVLIDDRRIHVDFSQSVSKVKWRGKGRGVMHFDEKGRKSQRIDSDIGKGNYKHKERFNTDRNRSRSPKVNKNYRNERRSVSPKRNRSNYDREYSRKSRNSDNRSSNNKPNKYSRSPERIDRNRSPVVKRDKYKSTDREKYTSKSTEDRSYSPRKRTDERSPSRKVRKYEESYSSSRNRKRSPSPRRKKSRSPIFKRNRDNGSGSRKRSRSLSPKKDRNRDYDKSDQRSTNVSTSTYKNSATEKKSHRRKSASSDDNSNSSDSDGATKYNGKDGKYSSKTYDTKKNRSSPERKKYSSNKSTKSDERDKVRDLSKEKEKKLSTKQKKYSSSESSDSESNDDGRKSKKKKSAKKSKRYETSSDSGDGKKKKKKKYESNSD